MKRNILYTLLAALFFISCASEGQGDTHIKVGQEGKMKKYEDVTVREFKEKLNASTFQLVDVRTPEECATGMIENARAMNINDPAFEAELNSLDPSIPVLVYCKSGGRSGRAMEMMKAKGIDEVYNLEGGITAWREAGEDIVE